MLATWPSSLPEVPLMPAGSSAPYQAPVETEMEHGPVRSRRTGPTTWTAITFSYVLDAQQFKVFEGFIRDTLQHGAARFRIPVWRPGARLPLPLRVARISGGVPSWRPAGAKVLVSLPLSVLDY